MNLSFSSRGWPELSWEEMQELAIDMGFHGIEVYNLHKNPALCDRGGAFHPYQIAATVRHLREKKLHIPCFDTSIGCQGRSSSLCGSLRPDRERR